MVNTFTRAGLTAALTEAGFPAIAEGLYADGNSRTLALDYEASSDIGVFLAVAGALTGDPIRFGAALETGLPGHPSCRGGRGATWPGYGLDEPSPEQWWDAVADCGVCTDDDLCAAHVHAPWDAMAGVR